MSSTVIRLPAVRTPSRRVEVETVHSRLTKLGKLVDSGGCSSVYAHDVVLDAHPHGFIAAVTTAFKDHYPLALRPQHIWLLIIQGIAAHVNEHFRELQSRWVPHEGKKTLSVVRNSFRLGRANDWEGVIDGCDDSFSTQIDSNLQETMKGLMVPDFSDTTVEEEISLKVAIMDVCQHFFEYKVCTLCGFPSITLDGTRQDWELLCTSAEALINQGCLPDFASEWLSALQPLLEKILEEYIRSEDGKLSDDTFWNSMCKLGGTNGSGRRTWFNGWINIFFPIINRRWNPYCVPYSNRMGYAAEPLEWNIRYKRSHDPTVAGPDTQDFPLGVSSAPVIWEYFGSVIRLEFKSGFIGASQDADTLTISPCVRWAVVEKAETKKTSRRNEKDAGDELSDL
jgi:hypothetical protein